MRRDDARYTVNGPATLGAHGEARHQIALADRIGLSKTDLIAAPLRAARLESLRAAIRDLNPFAPMANVAAGELGAAEFLTEAIGISLADAPASALAHAASLRAYAFAAREPVGAPDFARFQALLHAMLGPRLLRVKGLVALAEHPDEPLVVNGAQQILHAPRRLTAWPDSERRTRVVVIVDGVERAVIDRLWGALSGPRKSMRPTSSRSRKTRWPRGPAGCSARPWRARLGPADLALGFAAVDANQRSRRFALSAGYAPLGPNRP